nr:gliding motility-associated C-terminal domain-containing protein [Bacteroidota bacterium]
GVGYAGIVLRAIYVTEYAEYLKAPLEQPLIGGKYYYVSFWVSLPNSRCATERIGAFFSVKPPPYVWGDATPLDNLVPQVESGGTFLNDTTNWMLIEGCFRAEGGESYITIGNFHSHDDTPLDSLCTSSWNDAYYYIDDVYVAEVQPGGIDVELGDDFYTCYGDMLDPGLTGVEYYWSTGSIEPTITVISSGMYYLTVYNGCEAGVDSVEVFITDIPPLNFMETQIDICPGEELIISLNPDWGSYLWNDGSTATLYTISSTGTYAVSLDDGCDITSDSIHVTVVQPPPPVLFAGDTILCTGSQIELFFEPSLGDFLWNNNSTSNSSVITQAGVYTVTITNLCGVGSGLLEVFEVPPLYISLGPDRDTLCSGSSIDFALDSVAGTYVWQDGSATEHYQITQGGLYSVTMTSVCGPSKDSVLVDMWDIPLFDLGDTLSPCPGQPLVLSYTGIDGNYLWQNGTINDSLTVLYSDTFWLTIQNPCGIYTDTVNVIYKGVLLPPDLGPDFNLCPGVQAILYSDTNADQYLWQDNTTADTLVINNLGLYHVTVSNGCYTYADTVVVGLENDPPVIVLPDQVRLCQGALALLDPGVSGVTYTWNDGTHNPTLTLSSPGQYSLTVTNACGMDVDTVDVIDGGDSPTIDLGADVFICPGDIFNIQPQFTDVDTWLWQDASTAGTLLITMAGTIDVIVSNACGSSYDTLEVKVLNPIPVLDLGPDEDLCPGESLLLTISNQGVNILWSDNSTGSFLNIDQAGFYYADISNACGSAADSIVITSFSAIPALDLGPDQPLCPGEIITLVPGIVDVNYTWQDGSTSQTFLVDHDQTVSLTITNECGTATDELIIFLSNTGPDVDLGADIVGCQGDTVNITSDISGLNYTWQDGSANDSFITSSSGTYYVDVTNSCGADSDTIIVDLDAGIPLVQLGGDTMLCDGNSLLLISDAAQGTTITWQDGSEQSQFLVTGSGLYSLTVSNHCGEDNDTIDVAFIATPVDVDLGRDTVLCPGETLLLTAPVTTDNIEWQDGTANSAYLIDAAGFYSLTIKNFCGTTADEIAVVIDDHFPVFPGENQFDLCTGETIMLDVTQSGDALYLWSTGETTSVLDIITPGVYSVTVFTLCQQASYEAEIVAATDCGAEVNFYVPNVISPNGDNINDLFSIEWSSRADIQSISGTIYDRWGNVVFSSIKIPFIWDGSFNGDNVVSGVYVYKVEVQYKTRRNEGRQTLTGSVTVIR